MNNKKPPVFTLSIVAIILGVTLFKQFNFERMRFENTGLAIVYIIVFVVSVFILLRYLIKRK